MDTRVLRTLTPLVILFLSAPHHAAAQGYPGYPYTIMTPERGALPTPNRMDRQTARVPRARAGEHQGRRIAVARGSSGSVLPTPLPRTALIPPEGGAMAAVHIAPREQGPTVVPGLANPVPNLPHGTETFQDRASRCAMQQGLYNVPGTMSTQYMGACVQ